MNLYRSFGNLMEAWMSEGGQCSDNEEDSPTPTSEMGTNLRSESVDSGVETASSDASFPATSPTEIDTPGRDTPASTSQSPVLFSSSSSSPRLCPSRAQEGSHRKVEQTPQRTDSKKDDPERVSVYEVLRRRPRASVLPKRHTSEVVRGQKSGSFGPRRTVNPSASMRQMSETCRRPMSLSFDTQPAQTKSEDPGAAEGKALSPGLSYLEQVCQMLEDIARQQLHNRAPQMETDAPREHQDEEVSQALDTCQSDSKPAEEVLSSCPRLENTAEQTSSEPQKRKDYTKTHFRQRSASDTTLAKLHLRRLNADRGHHLSTNVLEEKEEEDMEKQDSEEDQTNKINKRWKLKFGSFRKEESSVWYTDGQQMQPSEKTSARRKLGQLFRRRRKTQPV